MNSPERVDLDRRHVRRDIDDTSDVKSGEEEWDSDDKRKHRSRRHRNGDDDVDDDDGGNKVDGRKRSGNSHRLASDGDDHGVSEKPRSKQMKRKSDEDTLGELSSWYNDGEHEIRNDNGAHRIEREKASSGFLEPGGSQSRMRGKHDRSLGEDNESKEERDSRPSERREYIGEKDPEHSELGGNSRRRWDQPETILDRSDGRSSGERGALDSKDSRSVRAYERDDRGANSRGRSEPPEEDNRRRHHELEQSELEYEREDSFKRGEIGKDRDRDMDHSKDRRNRRQSRDRVDERLQSRSSGGRKEGNRTEAVKTSSSKYGISRENYDVIEIQTKSFPYSRDDSGSTFPRRKEVVHQSELLGPNNDSTYPPEDGVGKLDTESATSVDDSSIDIQAGNAKSQQDVLYRSNSGQNSGSGIQDTSSPFDRARQQGVKVVGRGGRGWSSRPPGRDAQPIGVPLPMMVPPFGPLGMQQLNPHMPPTVPPMSPGVFLSPFVPPVVWPGGRGVEMGMLGVSPVMPPLSSLPSGPGGYLPNIGIPQPQAPSPYFNQAGPVRGMASSSNPPGPVFNAVVQGGRAPEKVHGHGNWVPPRTNAPPGKAPSRGEQNDYSQNFVDTGMRPQNFIRELELTSVVEDYPKLRELIQKKDEIVTNSASAPMYFKCDLREFELSPEFFGTKFDVILVDPPWEEYVHRAPGVADHMEYWKFEEIMNLKIEAIADTPSFIFLWVGDGIGLEQGRQCLKKWGFRRCEDICWVKTNKTNATPGLRHDYFTLFQRSKEHCLMGIKGTVRRSTDGHIIHANIDTDVIIAEEPPYGSTAKPEDMYRIIEHFALGRRRLELFGEDHNIRAGWLTVGKDLSSSNFDAKGYIKNFADKDGKVWQGGGGRNPPPESPHLVLTNSDIESLRPKSPMKNQQQQQSSTSISINTGNNKRPITGNSPQSFYGGGSVMNSDAAPNQLVPPPWAPAMGNLGPIPGPDGAMVSDMYGFGGGPYVQPPLPNSEYETHRGTNFL
ncbi:N6-adenosine-methyltransferase non-catalytic subunit MTB-like [Impatiens glandulifera]|uniref:N6-adenosine-methyltransferase non-catalytic subunit MTB-like n=1 Tax=Impatiens glandulifera TaxID=253017 RepID=UPI001FB0902E|nr:N6-adenosine-methyltransferase non-catalytic subunit MTB-like [Impatiens glandulifera]